LRVAGPDGKVIAESRSLAELNRQLGPLRSAAPAPVENQSSWSGDSFTDWTWDDWPERITVTRRGVPMDGFPALVDQETSVARQVLDTVAAAELASRGGLVRLFQLAERKLVRSQVAWLPELEKHKLRLSRRVPAGELADFIRDLLVRIALVEDQPLPRTRAAFMARREKAADSIGLATQVVAAWLPKLVAACEAADRQLAIVPAKHAEAAADVRQQLSHLLAPGFFRATPWRWLQHVPRYLSAAAWRLEKLPAAPPRQDGDRQRQVAVWWQQLEKLGGEHSLQGWLDPALEQFRWMIEEFRVSLFAQPLGTSLPVSDKRLEKQLQLVRRP
jgi:ATP-dependent helicase HrpA